MHALRRLVISVITGIIVVVIWRPGAEAWRRGEAWMETGQGSAATPGPGMPSGGGGGGLRGAATIVGHQQV